MIATRFRSILTTGGAALVSQLLVLVTMPVTARVFDETAFGALGLVVALSNILSVLAHLGYAEAVLAADNHQDADRIVQLVYWICGASIVPVALLSWAAIRFDILGYGALPLWAIGFVVAQVLFITLTFVYQQRVIRAEQYGLLAKSHLALGAARCIGQLSMALALANAAGLMLAEVASRVATTLTLYPSLPKAAVDPAAGAGAAVLMPVARQQGVFASHRAVAISLNTLNLALPVLIVSQHFSLVEVGAFSLTLSVIYAPIGYVQKALGDVFTGTYRSLLEVNLAQARRAILQMFALLTAMGLASGLVLYIFGVPIFQLVFGARWQLAGQTASLFAPVIALMVVIVPLATSLNILGRAGITLAFNLMRLAGLIAVMLAVGPYGLGLPADSAGGGGRGVRAVSAYGMMIDCDKLACLAREFVSHVEADFKLFALATIAYVFFIFEYIVYMQDTYTLF